MSMRLPLALRPVCWLLTIALICASGGTALVQRKDLQANGALNPLSKVDPSSLKGFLEAPLFSPTRTAATSLSITSFSADAKEQAPQPPRLRLLGIISTNRGLSARVFDELSQTSRSLVAGDAFEDWTVASLTPSSLSMRRAEETAIFDVFPVAAPVTANDADGQVESDPIDTARRVRVIDGTSTQPSTKAPGEEPRWKPKEVEGFFGRRE